jgi:hypothetical protein
LLLLAQPSVPNETVIPAFSIPVIGAIPEASFMLLSGQWETAAFRLAMMSISASSTQTQWAIKVRLSRMPNRSRWATGVRPFSLTD